MALHTDLELYAVIFDLAGEAGDVVIQMRHAAKPIWGRKIIDACIEMDLDLMAANMAPNEEKDPHLVQLLRRLHVVEHVSRVCRDRKYFAPSHYARLIERTQSIGRQTSGLRKWLKEQGAPSQRQLFGSQGSSDRA